MERTPESYLELALEFLGTVGFLVFVIICFSIML